MWIEVTSFDENLRLINFDKVEEVIDSKPNCQLVFTTLNRDGDFTNLYVKQPYSFFKNLLITKNSNNAYGDL